MAYPTVNYIGNKEKLVDWIVSLIPSDAKSFFDAFAGGSSVAYAAKKKGLQVFANDILQINYLIALALIENSEVRLSNSDVDNIFQGELFNGFMFENFSNVFYFPEECSELDNIHRNICALEDKNKKAMAWTLMRRAMVRKMPYSRFTIKWDKIKQLRDEEYSYRIYKRRRHYHNQSFEFHFRDNLVDYNQAVFDNGKENKAFNLDIYDAINYVDADVIYLDPPYAGTMNDYFGFYGLLDAYIKNKIVEPFNNNFIDVKTIVEQFDELFSHLSKYKYWMISYNSRSKPSKEEMLAILSKYSTDIEVHEMPHAYKVTGKEKKQKDVEFLFIVKNEKQS